MKIVIFHSYVSLPEGKLILIHIKPVGAGETCPGISSTYWISNGDVCNLYSKILTLKEIQSHSQNWLEGHRKTLKLQWKAWFSVFFFHCNDPLIFSLIKSY